MSKYLQKGIKDSEKELLQNSFAIINGIKKVNNVKLNIKRKSNSMKNILVAGILVLYLHSVRNVN